MQRFSSESSATDEHSFDSGPIYFGISSFCKCWCGFYNLMMRIQVSDLGKEGGLLVCVPVYMYCLLFHLHCSTFCTAVHCLLLHLLQHCCGAPLRTEGHATWAASSSPFIAFSSSDSFSSFYSSYPQLNVFWSLVSGLEIQYERISLYMAQGKRIPDQRTKYFVASWQIWQIWLYLIWHGVQSVLPYMGWGLGYIQPIYVWQYFCFSTFVALKSGSLFGLGAPLIVLCAIIFLLPHSELTVGRRWCGEHECEGRYRLTGITRHQKRHSSSLWATAISSPRWPPWWTPWWPLRLPTWSTAWWTPRRRPCCTDW